jgi:hypothetical protein
MHACMCVCVRKRICVCVRMRVYVRVCARECTPMYGSMYECERGDSTDNQKLVNGMRRAVKGV